MKKLLGIFALICFSTMLNGQKSIDDLFAKYGGKDGFTTVTINGNLLKLAGDMKDEDNNESMPKNIGEIRILAQDKEDMKVDNFYDLVIKDLDLSKYEDFMQVKESNQNVRMLVRTEGDRFKEFLLIVGGKDNALIQIKGDMSLKEAKKFAEDAKKGHGTDMIEKEK